MSIWVDTMLERWALSGGVHPYERANVNPASIDLRWSGKLRRAGTHRAYLRMAEHDVYTLPAYTSVMLDTLEHIVMPVSAAGIVTLKSTWFRRGLALAAMGWVDPGYTGTLTVVVYNISNVGIMLRRGERIVQLVMMSTASYPAAVYAGAYQGAVTPAVAAP